MDESTEFVMTFEMAAKRLLADRLFAIELALGFPDYGSEPTISEADVMEGSLSKYVVGVLWPDLRGEPECLKCSRETLMDPGSDYSEGYSRIKTGIAVMSDFTCQCQAKASIAS